MRKIRKDADGDGHFGAARGARLHKGIDLEYAPDEPVTAEISGYVNRIVLPYADDLDYTGIEVKGRVLIWHGLYITPLKKMIGSFVKKGTIVGYAQDIRKRYPQCKDMKNHTHNNFYCDYCGLRSEIKRMLLKLTGGLK